MKNVNISISNSIISGIVNYITYLNGSKQDISIEYKDGEASIFKANKKLISGTWFLDLPFNDYFHGNFSQGKFITGNARISNGLLKTKTSGKFVDRKFKSGTIIFDKINFNVVKVFYSMNKTILRIENSKCGNNLNNIMFSCVLEGPTHNTKILSLDFYKDRSKNILSYSMYKGNIDFYKITNYYGGSDYDGVKIASFEKDNKRCTIWTDEMYEPIIKKNFLYFNCNLMAFIKIEKVFFVNEKSKKIYCEITSKKIATIANGSSRRPATTGTGSSSRPVTTTARSSSRSIATGTGSSSRTSTTANGSSSRSVATATGTSSRNVTNAASSRPITVATRSSARLGSRDLDGINNLIKADQKTSKRKANDTNGTSPKKRR